MTEALNPLPCRSTTRYLDPFLFNRTMMGRTLDCVVAGDGTAISYQGNTIDYRLDTPLPLGTKLKAKISYHGIEFFENSPNPSHPTDSQPTEKKQPSNRQALEDKRIAAAETFNAALNIPVGFKLVYKIVLSGLSAHGNGDGTNRRSVAHIQLDAPLVDGRLKRESGDLLCGGDHGSFDTREAGVTKVSCQQCLKIAKRWSHQKTPLSSLE